MNIITMSKDYNLKKCASIPKPLIKSILASQNVCMNV